MAQKFETSHTPKTGYQNKSLGIILRNKDMSKHFIDQGSFVVFHTETGCDAFGLNDIMATQGTSL